jgi:spore coat polysaccharide biosynthesis protein SpsF
MTVLTILQARMTSSRLPGKVLKDMHGQPMMGRQIERLRRGRRLGQLVVATSVDPTDDAVEAFARSIDCPVHRGPLADVLARYAQAYEAFGPAEHVVRVTADCPLTDWRIIDQCIALHLESGADYTSNTVERTYAKGLDVEVFKGALLPAVAAEAQTPYEREHVTPFFYHRPERFKIAQLTQAEDLSALRWTVDTPEDYAFTTRVYDALFPGDPDFSADDILALGWTRWTGE